MTVPASPVPNAPQMMPAPGPAPTSFAPAGPAAPRTGLGHALKSEWTKIRTVRSTMWTLSAMFTIVVGIALLVAAFLHGRETDMPLLAEGVFGLILGQLAVITLGVMVITSEYATGMIRTTLTACPKRWLVLTAKAMVFFGVSFLMTAVACTITALINWAAMSEQSIQSQTSNAVVKTHIVADTGQWLGATVGAALYVALLGVLSLAVGALLRHTAGAVTAMMGVVLLPLLISMFMFASSLSDIRDFLVKYSVINGLACFYQISLTGSGHPTGWSGLGLLAGITAIVLAGAYAVLEKRDV